MFDVHFFIYLLQETNGGLPSEVKKEEEDNAFATISRVVHLLNPRERRS